MFSGFKVFLIIAAIVILSYMGSKRTTLGMRINNPFNLRSGRSAWRGKIGDHEKGFVIFDTLENGVRAGIINLKNGYFSKKLSIEQLVNKYAPATENNVFSYINHIGKYAPEFTPGYVPSNLRDYMLVCKAIVRMEQGFDAVEDDLIMKYLNS